MKQTNTLLNSCWLNYFSHEWHKSISFFSPIQGENPGWYIWPEANLGVFEIQLLEWQTKTQQEDSRFILKYYPSPDEESFNGLASAEKIIRLSHWFDDSPIEERQSGCACSALAHHHTHGKNKGIPHYHNRKNLQPSLFTVGEILLKLESDKFTQISLTSQDRLLLIATSAISVEHEGALIQLTPPGGIDRDLPGWTISWHFFEILVKEVLARLGFYPTSCTRVVNPGLVYYQQEGGEIREEKDSDVTQITHTFYF